MDIAFASDRGVMRSQNEDSCYVSACDGEALLFVVADGMGGHNAGEVASCLAVDTIKDMFGKSLEADIPWQITQMVNEANKAINALSAADRSLIGMGTTVVVGIVRDGKLYIGHVGDSRAYLVRGGEITQLTTDHSMVEELVRVGTITKEEAAHHPQKNIITRALGGEISVRVDNQVLEIYNDDIILFCTDGLTNMVCDGQICDILINTGSMSAAVQRLIDTANKNGGTDNITAIALVV